ncbi:MAG: SulP family inorganic anion transporter [Anaerolineaceae bacterium]|nr:SulP family inorganic anion transporter [Anaerolineaceae bacterium]MDE0329772.1 SulP family inorganic anion transporter [Anaerolineaceae bacterium]
MPDKPAILNYLRRNCLADLLAGASGAAAGVPMAMGFAIIAGLSPVYGLYAIIVATIVAALTTSSVFLTVSPTNALALIVGSMLVAGVEADFPGRVFTLTLLVGILQLALGLARAGNLFRFVSNAVMTGFVSGAGLLIIINQLPALTGLASRGSGNALGGMATWPQALGQLEVQSLFVGLLSVGLVILLKRTRAKLLAMLLALIVSSALVALAGWHGVLLTGDLMTVPAGLPKLVLPNPAYVPDIALVAVAIALLASLQSAGLTRMVPQPDGSQSNVHRDLTGQGLANIAGGLFQGLPSGGSLSRTAINLSAGAHGRMANVFSGLFVAAILLVLGPLVERIPLAALAGQLIVAATSLIRPDALRMAWRVSVASRSAMVVTFMSTLLFPLEYSVYIGVFLSLLLYVWTSASNLQIRRLVETGDGQFREEGVPDELPGNEVIIFSVAGNLYFAAVSRLEDLLPVPATNSGGSVVILRLRDNQYLGSTGISFLREYARKLEAGGGRLLLAAVSQDVLRQLDRTGEADWLEPVFPAEDVVFASTRRALAWARDWLKLKESESA